MLGEDGGGAASVEEAGAGAHAGHIHDPGENLTAEPGSDEGQDHHEEQRVLGSAGLAEVGELGGQSVGVSHGVDETAGRHIEAVDAGDHGAEHCDAAEEDTHVADVLQDHLTGGPVGVGGQHGLPGIHDGGDEDHGGVDEAAYKDGADHEAEGRFMGEAVFLGRLRDGIKAHEAVGSEGNHAHDAGEGGFAFLEVGLQVGVVRMLGEGHDEDEEHGGGQGHGHQGLEPTGALDAPDIDDAQADDEGVGQQDLTDIDIPTGDGVEIAELEGGAGEDVAGDHGESGGVQGDQGPIGQHQGPAADEGVLLAERGVRVHELAAGKGELLDHVAIAEADDGDDESTQHQTGDGADGASLGQELGTGHDEAAPADDGTQGQGPDVDLAKVFLKLAFSLRLIRHRMNLLFSDVCLSLKCIAAKLFASKVY